MRRRFAAVVLATVLSFSVVGTDMAVAATPVPSGAYSTQGPVGSAPTADHGETRYYYWGYEVLFSKGNSKAIVSGTFGAIGATGFTIPGWVGKAALVGAGFWFGFSNEKAYQAIDKGRCLKLIVIYPTVPSVGTYQCT